MAWGCEGEAAEKIEIEGEQVTRCPKRLFYHIDPRSEDFGEVLWYYSAYKRGQLPNAGGLQDQPGMLMDLFKVIDGAVNTIEQMQTEKLKADRGAGNRRGGARLVPKSKPAR